jgi:hypothetical protein
VALAEIDLANVIAGNSSFARNRTHKIADLHTIARSDGHEKPRHASCCSMGSIAISRPRLGRGDRVLSCRAPLGPLALEQVKRGSCELRRIEFFEQRLEGDDLAGRNAAVQHCPQLLTHGCLAIMCAALRAGEIERREPSTSELPQPGDFSGPGQDNDLNRFCLSDSLKLCRSDRRLEKDHRVGWSAEIALSRANVRVVIVIAQRAESLPSALGGWSVARHYQG